MRTAWFTCLLVLVVACRDGEDPDWTDDPNCHWDCFGYHECADGVVTTFESTPVPCEYWDGECPHAVTYQCVEGCRIDIDTVDVLGDDPSIACEENRPKQVGDVCADDSDCRPEVATWNDLGEVSNVYLHCDTAAGVCVERDPPVVPDWLAPCELTYPGWSYGVAESDVCASGRCLFVVNETCVAQGCTIECASDGECPLGAVCEPDWGVCKPGPPGWIGVGLTCP